MVWLWQTLLSKPRYLFGVNWFKIWATPALHELWLVDIDAIMSFKEKTVSAYYNASVMGGYPDNLEL